MRLAIIALCVLVMGGCASSTTSHSSGRPPGSAPNWIPLHENPRVGDFARYVESPYPHQKSMRIIKRTEEGLWRIHTYWRERNARTWRHVWELYVDDRGFVKRALIHTYVASGRRGKVGYHEYPGVAMPIAKLDEFNYFDPGTKQAEIGILDFRLLAMDATRRVKRIHTSKTDVGGNLYGGKYKVVRATALDPNVKFGVLRDRAMLRTSYAWVDIVVNIAGGNVGTSGLTRSKARLLKAALGQFFTAGITATDHIHDLRLVEHGNIADKSASVKKAGQ